MLCMGTINRKLKIVQLNAENLFLFMDFYKGENLSNMTEIQWQNLSSSTQSNKSLSKTKWLAEAVLDMNPDILLLSEVGGWESAQNFNRHFLNNTYEVLMAEGNSDRGIDVAFLLRRELGFSSLLLSYKDKILDFNYPLDAPGVRHSFSRDALELRLFLPDQDRAFLSLFNLHLKSKLDREKIDPQGRARRKAELNAFLEILKTAQTELPDCHFIVGGDFNGIHSPKELSESEFSALHADSDLIEVFEHCALDASKRATQIQFQTSSKIIPLQLDGIWVSKNLAQYVVTEETGVYMYKSDLGVGLPYVRSLGQRLAMPSDHYPVMTSINLK